MQFLPSVSSAPIPALSQFPPPGNEFRAFPTPQHLLWHPCVLPSLPNISWLLTQVTSPPCPEILQTQPMQCSCSSASRSHLMPAKQSSVPKEKDAIILLAKVYEVFLQTTSSLLPTLERSHLWVRQTTQTALATLPPIVFISSAALGAFVTFHMLPVPVQGGLEWTSRRLSKTQAAVPRCCLQSVLHPAASPAVVPGFWRKHKLLTPSFSPPPPPVTYPPLPGHRAMCHTSCMEGNCLKRCIGFRHSGGWKIVLFWTLTHMHTCTIGCHLPVFIILAIFCLPQALHL